MDLALISFQVLGEQYNADEKYRANRFALLSVKWESRMLEEYSNRAWQWDCDRKQK